MASPYSKRLLVPVEERHEQAIAYAKEKASIKNYPRNKVAEWLREDNVKEFNKILLDKAFNKHIPLTDTNILNQELTDYFKTCYDCDIVPSIASLCVWLGTNQDTIYSIVSNKSVNYESLQQAIKLCHSIQENGAISGSINSVLYMFLAKNYYGLNDNSTINLTSTLQDNTINNSNTMKVIQEQILEEEKEK